MTAGSGVATWGGAPLRRIYVIAGNYREFVNWCQANKIGRHDPRIYYVQDFTRLLGLRIEESKGDHVVLYGTYQSRMDWSAMVEELKIVWCE